VVVLNHNNCDAVLLGLEEGGVLQSLVVRAALATALFRIGDLCLVRAAHVDKLAVLSVIARDAIAEPLANGFAIAPPRFGPYCCAKIYESQLSSPSPGR
jgi:hypothetical protein